MKNRRSIIRHSYNYLFFIVIFSAMFLASTLYGAPVFTDDFESGNLANWIIGGRQLGSNTADVVDYGGSLSGHLQHSSFTEIKMHRDFQFDEFDMDDSFYFDLAVSVSSTSPPASNYYGWAGITFIFLDTNSDALGGVYYGAATTDHPFTVWAAPDEYSVNQIDEGAMNHFEITIADMLSQITLNQTLITDIRMEGNTYSSTYPYPIVSAELWIDNVSTIPPPNLNTVPVPSTILLFGTGLVGLVVSRIRRKKK